MPDLPDPPRLDIAAEAGFIRVSRRHCPACRRVRVVYDLFITVAVAGGFASVRRDRRCAPCFGIR